MIDRREMGEWGNAASTTVFFLLPVLCIRGEKTSTCCVLCWLFLVRQGERRAPVVRCAVCGGGWHTICRNRHTDVTAHRCNRHTNRSRLHVTLGRSALAVACGRGGAGGGGARTERARPRSPATSPGRGRGRRDAEEGFRVWHCRRLREAAGKRQATRRLHTPARSVPIAA